MGAEKPKSTAGQVQDPTRIVVNAAGVLLAPRNPLRNSVAVLNEDTTNSIAIGYTSGVTYSGTSTPGANDGAVVEAGASVCLEHYIEAVYAAWDGTHAVTVSVIEE